MRTKKVDKIINSLMAHYGFKTYVELASFFDYAPSAIQKWLERDSIPPKRLLLKDPTLNKQFLLTGEGPVANEAVSVSKIDKIELGNTSDLPRSIMQTVAALEELLGDQSPEVRSDPVLRRLSQELAGHLLEKIQLLRSSGGPGSEQA